MSNFEESVEMKTGEELDAFFDHQGEQQEDRRIIDEAESQTKQEDAKKIIDHGDWETVIDENECGLFRVKHYCKFCGTYNTYGTPPFCMYCGHKMRVKNKTERT